MKIEKVNINTLVSPDYNPRDMPPAEMEKLKTSIEEFGYVDPIIVNEVNNHIVGGNQRYEAMKELDFEEVEVSYVHIEDLNREKALNIMLNKVSGEFDEGKLHQIFTDFKLEGFENTELTGFNEEEIQELLLFDEYNEVEDNTPPKESKYTSKIDIPHYEITGKKPTLEELIDTSKTVELQEKINNTDLPSDIKEFLINSSYRFLEFDYGNIAEYYAHANQELQEIMEDLALVIIDFDKAIADGYVEFSNKMQEIVKRDYGDIIE